MSTRVFLLSPAHCGGQRARILLRDEAAFPLALKLRAGEATIGEVFSFVSGLYFRGKLAYGRAFARPPKGLPGTYVITPNEGLRLPNEVADVARVRGFGSVDLHADEPRFREPLRRDASSLHELAGADCEYVLLGSVATAKYVEALLEVFGERLTFPSDFVGRGDMSRGGLLLRCVDDERELAYVPVQGAVRHGNRPPKLAPRPGLMARHSTVPLAPRRSRR